MILLHIAALIAAIALTPWLFARLLIRSGDKIAMGALWGPVMVTLNIAVPLGIQFAGLTITANALAFAHLALAGVAFVSLNLMRQTLHPTACTIDGRWFTASAVLFVTLVFPVGHIAGIDTYKWQDLAGSVAVEGRIAWLVHPLSLFGFTPRSYPSAQPLVLATIEMLGHTGVDWGFYILSCALGLTGLFGARLLGRHLFTTERHAAWFAFLYVFSPVFLRYNYWATGRGLLLAILPLYLLSLLRLPALLRKTADRPIPLILWLPAFLAMSILLALAHKAGLIGAILIPLLFLASPLLIVARGRWVLWVLVFVAAGCGFALAGYSPVILLSRLATRFAWLAPLAVLGLWGSPDRFTPPSARTMLSGGLATLILSCTPDMYGALLALPFVTYAAVIGFTFWENHWPQPTARTSWITHKGPAPILASLTLLAALAIILNQASDAPGHSLYRAAQFIEQDDPRGPFRIEAPGRARTQIQAYVSGCPRFTVIPGKSDGVRVHPLPERTGNPAHDARVWIDYLRKALDLNGASTDWYGNGDKIYSVTVNGEGLVPLGGRPVFQDGSVQVFVSP